MDLAICDDEPLVCERLQALIKKEAPSAAVHTFLSSEELLSCEMPFALALLDIEMPAPNGIETARLLRQKNADICIIFVTAVKEYVFDAFDVAAFHYLLKPIDEAKFAAVFSRAMALCESRLAAAPLTISTRQKSYVVAPADILFAESSLKKIILHTTSDNIVFYGNLRHLEQQLGRSFFRCHRGFLVNFSYIRSYAADEIRLTDGATVYMAKERYAAFKTAYLQFLKNGGVSYV